MLTAKATPPFTSPVREFLRLVLAAPLTEAIVTAAIAANVVCMIIETDRGAVELEPLHALMVLNTAILGLYTVESVCKIFVYRAGFLRHPWDVFDLFVVCADYAMIILESFLPDVPVSFLRVFRLVRLARSARVLRVFPELATMAMGLYNTMRIAICGVVALCGILIVFGIMSVHILHPINQRVAASGAYDGCDRCPRAFQSTWHAALTFTQQIVTGDSWGTVTIPVIEEEPASALFFLVVFVFIAMMIMNIILSMVVEASVQSAADDQMVVLKHKQAAYLDLSKRVKAVFQELDVDNSGYLDLDEILKGFDESADFQAMLATMEIERHDLDEFFKLWDADNAGVVDYDNLIDQLYKMKMHDPKTTSFMLKRYVSDLCDRVAKLEGTLSVAAAAKAPSIGGSQQAEHVCEDIETVEATADADRWVIDIVQDLSSSLSSDVSRMLRDLEAKANGHAARLRELRTQQPEILLTVPQASAGSRGMCDQRMNRHGGSAGEQDSQHTAAGILPRQETQAPSLVGSGRGDRHAHESAAVKRANDQLADPKRERSLLPTSAGRSERRPQPLSI